MSKRKAFAPITLTALVALALSIQAAAPSAQRSRSGMVATVLVGVIQSATGQKMEGVVVSARADADTITTSVFTDEQGHYLFPPIHKGKYRVWAQAVGFEAARAQVDIDPARETRQDFTLKTLEDFSLQLSGTEWINSLPDETPADRRMKDIIQSNCAGCHTPNYALQNRFDEKGWRAILDVMERTGATFVRPPSDRAPFPILHALKDEIAAYLAQVRGPGPSPMKLKVMPRPRGEAAQVVITEYDIPSSERPGEFVVMDGSDWSQGTPSSWEARAPHDAEVDANGIVWWADDAQGRVRTIGKLDPKTGKFEEYGIPTEDGTPVTSHGLVIDQKDIVWFTTAGGRGERLGGRGGLGRFDPKRGKIERFDPPEPMPGVGGTVDVDLKGNIWASAFTGALKFDPITKKFTNYPSVSRGAQGNTYGVAVDSQGNGWWAQMNYDILGVGDGVTGKSSEVVLSPRPGKDENITDFDRELYKRAGADWNSVPPWHQGPRRLSADKRGDAVWVANWWGDNIAKIDIKTHKVTYYPAPTPNSGPYDTVVDKNHMVWVNMMNSDRVARFDPKTEKWTEFRLPSLGTETRFIAVDDHKDPVEVWTPYFRTNRIARIQFRDPRELQALKQRVSALKSSQ